ncbi:MAG: hypothetical protein LBQ87_04420 [Candidatus Fibromonas sp.]|jgi:hypothetical protein|nr:hypothetical protein [Candidatus Fibromonas sp.]
MKNFISFFCVFASLALATETYQNQVAIDSVAESLNSRKGIEISGTLRGISYSSDFSSEQEKPRETGRYINQMPDKEVAEFVQLDLNFLFRPWDNVSANLKLRLGAGMQEYFAAAATLVNAPWMNIQGNALDGKFHWIVGDFRQSYSPLTLYAPGLDILYEPVVFARKREIAMGDALLEGNKRNLQGFNLQFRPDFGETIGELRVEALGARLRRAGFLDSSGAMGNILPNENIPGSSQAGTFDKFLLGGNVELLPLNKNVLVGVSYLIITDSKNSAMRRPNGNYVNVNDTLPQETKIFAGRAGFDLAGFMSLPDIVANTTVEYASSNDNVHKFAEFFDEEGNSLGERALNKYLQGSAILASLDVGYKSDFKAVLSGNFIVNDSAWFNPLAQSSQFLPRRILNSDKDGDLSKYGVYSPLYSTFDALYNFTPKHSPISKARNTGAYVAADQTQSYNIVPYTKNSWNAATLTRAELALLDELSDLTLQTALPNGLATANRTGATGTLTLGYGKNIEAKCLFTSLTQHSAVIPGAKEAAYTEYGGGAKIDVLGMAGFENNPLELSASYKHSQKEQEIGDAKSEFNSDFINAGLYYRFFRRFGLTFGYQKIDSDLSSAFAAGSAAWKVQIVPVVKSVQDQWMAGIDYTIAPHAWLSINYGIITVDNTYNAEGLQTYNANNEPVSIVGDGGAIITNRTNLPDYIAAVRAEDAGKLKHKFSRNVLEAAINVEF